MIRSSFPPQAATRSFYFAVVLSVIAFAISAQITTAQGPRVRPGRYQIQNVASDKFMDIDRNDGSIRQWEFGNQRSQLWDIEQMVMSTSHPQKTGCFWTSPAAIPATKHA